MALGDCRWRPAFIQMRRGLPLHVTKAYQDSSIAAPRRSCGTAGSRHRCNANVLACAAGASAISSARQQSSRAHAACGVLLLCGKIRPTNACRSSCTKRMSQVTAACRKLDGTKVSVHRSLGWGGGTKAADAWLKQAAWNNHHELGFHKQQASLVPPSRFKWKPTQAKSPACHQCSHS